MHSLVLGRVHARKPPTVIVLDIDSSESETHGVHEGSVYNGHFGCTCYQPLFVFNRFGDLEFALCGRARRRWAGAIWVRSAY